MKSAMKGKNAPKEKKKVRFQDDKRQQASSKPEKAKQGEIRHSSAPIAKGLSVRTPRPKMTTLPNGDCLITHREYIQDVVAGTGTPSVFNNTTIPINPGQRGTFQWLSRVAVNYESYNFEKLNFVYETEAPTTLGGTLVLAVIYDATEPAAATKQQAMAYRSAIRSAPWLECKHVSMKEDLRKSKTSYVRPAAQPANTDLKTYDIGFLNLITQGVTTASSVLGELYVEYTVRLMTPVYEDASFLALGGTITGANTQTAANPLGIAPTLGANTNGVTVDALSNISFQFPGTYLLDVFYTGTVITADAITPAVGINAPKRWTVVLVSGLNMGSSYQIKVNQPGTIALAVTATTITAASVHIAIAPTSSIL